VTLQEVALHLGEAQRRDLRRFFVVSVLLHLAAVASFGWAPNFSMMEAAPGVISVEIVTAPGLAPPTPAPAPARPKPPAPAPVVLPEEPSVPEPPPKPEEAKPKPKPEPPPEPEAPVERDLNDVLADLRQEVGDPEPVAEAPAPAPRAAVAGGGGSRLGRPLPPEVAVWMRSARIHIRKTWVVPPGFRNESLETVVEVDLAADGSVRGEPDIVSRSGNPWYDEGVVRSIQKASPLPAPPEAGRWVFVLLSDESY
jgi:outer membrane biosynthesis protein TonB